MRIISFSLDNGFLIESEAKHLVRVEHPGCPVARGKTRAGHKGVSLVVGCWESASGQAVSADCKGNAVSVHTELGAG